MLASYTDKSEKWVIGLMSGTSLDGIDAAVVRVTGCGAETGVELVHFLSEPYPPEVRARLRELCTRERSDVALVCGMNFYLGERFAQAALAAAAAAGLSMNEIDLISSHGQTVWHIPADDAGDPFLVRSTLQIGDLSVIAKRTGVPVVGDFRTADMAVGGQGAPLVPYADYLLFRSEETGRIAQNIGGIANCTVIPAGAKPEDVYAFDTGPGNMVIDRIVSLLTDGRRHYDEGGAWAAEGRVDEELVEEALGDPYFHQPPPKTTGREQFGEAYARAWLDKAKRRGLREADIVASATALTARSIADSYLKFVLPNTPVHEVIVSGGGAHNRTLLGMLADLLPEVRIRRSGDFGVHEDAKEAVVFALLGNDFMHGIANQLPRATGAERPTVMGKLALPW